LNGGGIMQLSGVNTFTGPTTISAGTLTIGGAGQLGSGTYAANLTNNAALNYGSTAAQTLSGIISGTGTLTKSSSSTFTLSGVNSYSGTTTISAGELIGVTGGSCASSAVSIANGATNGVQLAAVNGQWTAGGLTYGATGTDTTYADFNFGSVLPSAGIAPIQVNGNLAFNGTLNVIVRGGTSWAIGTYPLIKYTGTLSGTPPSSVLSLPAGVTASIVNNTANQSVDLKVTADTGITQVTWAVGNQTWDTVTANWTNVLLGGALTTYANGEQAILDDTASGASPITVTLSSTINPTNVTANLTNKNYTLSGTGAISGSGSLVKNGTGTLTVSTTNSFTGGTVVKAGILQLGTPNALGTTGSVVVVSGGVLDLNGLNLGVNNNAVTLNGVNALTNSSATRRIWRMSLWGPTPPSPTQTRLSSAAPPIRPAP